MTTPRALPIAALLFAAALSACSDSATGPLDAFSNAAALRGSSSSPNSPTTDRIRLIAQLSPPAAGTFRSAKGKAKWDSRDANSKREIEYEVEHLQPAMAVEFFLDGVRVGSATTNMYGQAEIEFETEDGQPVPESVLGLAVEVRTTDGTVIVAGAFPAT